MHTAVGNTRIQEFIGANGVAKAQVKRNGMCLGVQKDLTERLFARLGFCCSKKCGAHALTAMGYQDRHPTDLARWQQTGATNGITVSIECKQMAGRRVIIIPFKFNRHVLFFNENGRAHRNERRFQCSPWAAPQDYLRDHRLILHQRQCTRHPC